MRSIPRALQGEKRKLNSVLNIAEQQAAMAQGIGFLTPGVGSGTGTAIELVFDGTSGTFSNVEEAGLAAAHNFYKVERIHILKNDVVTATSETWVYLRDKETEAVIAKIPVMGSAIGTYDVSCPVMTGDQEVEVYCESSESGGTGKSMLVRLSGTTYEEL